MSGRYVVFSIGRLMDGKELVKDFLQNEKAPCDDCENRSTCKEYSLACYSFKAWVNNTASYEDYSRLPDNEVYSSLYRS